VILAQHAGHELFGKDKIVEKIDRDLPPFLGCQKAPEDGVGMGSGVFMRFFGLLSYRVIELRKKTLAGGTPYISPISFGRKRTIPGK